MKKKIIILYIFILINFHLSAFSNVIANSFINNINNNIIRSTHSLNNNKTHLINKIVAVVNNEAITSFDLDQAISNLKKIKPNLILNNNYLNIKKYILWNLIYEKLLLQYAYHNKITISKKELNKIINNIAVKNHTTVQYLKLNIQSAGISFNNYRNNIMNQLIINKLKKQIISKQIYISAKEIKNYIKKHKKELNIHNMSKKLYTIRNIITSLPTSKKLYKNKIDLFNKLTIKINEHKINFLEAVKKFSEALNKNYGGIVTRNTTFDLIPDIYKKYITKLKNHQASQPFIINNTLQILYVDNIYKKSLTLNKKFMKYYIYGIEINITNNITKKIAKTILKKIRNYINRGENFSKVAIQYNQNYNYPDGKFKWVSEFNNKLPNSIFKHIKKLKKNEISEPFMIDDKTYIIIKYTKKKQYNIIKQIEKQNAFKILFLKKYKKIYKNWIRLIKNNAYIKII